jgi:hypothetical protein
MMVNTVMYDAIEPSLIPSDAVAVAGYVDGHWPTFASLAAMFPRALRLSIAVIAVNDADCLDVENGDATAAQAPAWVRRQRARGASQPCLYASASNMAGVMAALADDGVSLDDVRLWSAHYGAGEHICGPASCGLVNRVMDGTQWTSSALGRNLDQSLLAPGFFPWYDLLMAEIPTVHPGSTGQFVKNWQSLLIARGYSLTMDGDFGAITEAYTKAFQVSRNLVPDGIAGPVTYTEALTVA